MRCFSTAKILAIPTIIMATSIVLTACHPSQQANNTAKYSKINGETMGTTYNISFTLPEGVDSTAIQTEIDKKLVAFNNELSTWQDDSTITKFNNAPATMPITIQADFVKVFNDSKAVYKQSGGTFDPTVKPILELWGFGKEMRVDKLQNPPTESETAQAKKLIDFNSVTAEKTSKGFQISKTKEGVAVDFSAIAKGYGVDVIAHVLKSNYKINNYMVEIGGEVATSGVNPKGKGWQIAIDAPIPHSGVADRKLIATIRQPLAVQEVSGKTDTKTNNKTNSMHLATSGNYRNSIVFDGVRYSHTIDPHTGKPIVGGASSVTVADDTVALADAWATALTAMPYEKALQTAQELDKAVMFIVLKDGVDTNKDNHTIDDWQIVETDKMKAMRAIQAEK